MHPRIVFISIYFSLAVVYRVYRVGNIFTFALFQTRVLKVEDPPNFLFQDGAL